MKLGVALARRVPPASPGPVVLLFKGPTQGYRDYVALMWDRKHPVEVRQLRIDRDFRVRGRPVAQWSVYNCA